jgi:hypothetical protein
MYSGKQNGTEYYPGSKIAYMRDVSFPTPSPCKRRSPVDAIANVALVFGWTPTDMAGMALGELMDWREQARGRYEASA